MAVCAKTGGRAGWNQTIPFMKLAIRFSGRLARRSRWQGEFVAKKTAMFEKTVLSDPRSTPIIPREGRRFRDLGEASRGDVGRARSKKSENSGKQRRRLCRRVRWQGEFEAKKTAMFEKPVLSDPRCPPKFRARESSLRDLGEASRGEKEGRFPNTTGIFGAVARRWRRNTLETEPAELMQKRRGVANSGKGIVFSSLYNRKFRRRTRSNQ